MSKANDFEENMKDIFESMDGEVEAMLEENVLLMEENLRLKARVCALEEVVKGYEKLNEYTDLGISQQYTEKEIK